MAKSPKPNKAEERGLRQEIFGIAILAAALYVAVSLYPYGASNPGGVVGGYLSWALKKAVGYTSYIFPLLLIALSFKFLLRKVFVISYAVPAAIVVLILSVSAMLGSSSEEAGGIAGRYLNSVLENLLGSPGAFIVLSAVALISIVVATGVSFVQAGIRIVPSAVSMVRTMTGRPEEAGPEEEGGAGGEGEDEIGNEKEGGKAGERAG